MGEINLKMHKIYQELMESMTGIVRSQEDAFWIFWSNVAQLINQSDMRCKNDCFGMLMSTIKGDNCMCNHIYFSVENGQSDYNNWEYKRILEKYAFSDQLDQLGRFWKELIREEKISRIMRVYGWLDIFQKKIIPFVDKYIGDFEGQWGEASELNKENYLNRERRITKIKKSFKKLEDKMLVVCEIIKLR